MLHGFNEKCWSKVMLHSFSDSFEMFSVNQSSPCELIQVINLERSPKSLKLYPQRAGRVMKISGSLTGGCVHSAL